MPKLPVTSRRRFLEMVAVTAVAGVGCSGKNDGSPEAFGDVSAGNVKDLAVGTLKAVPSAPAAIGRDEQGLWAMTTTCTHEGCDITSGGSIDFGGLRCPCHGASFDRNGNPTGGPAKGGLVHYAVSVDASGTITVHGGQPVDASARTKVGG